LATFLVFSSGKESHPNGPSFYFSFAAAICPETQFSANPVILQKVISPKPLIGWWQVNTHWKD
jgi:hypothetical protein